MSPFYEMVKEEQIGPVNITRLLQIDVFKEGVDDETTQGRNCIHIEDKRFCDGGGDVII